MALSIVNERAANADIDEHFAYLAVRNMDAAVRYYDAVRQLIEHLAEMPGIGTLREYKNPALAGLRMFPVRGFSNYLIFYRVIRAELHIIRVLHGARDVNAILEAN